MRKALKKWKFSENCPISTNEGSKMCRMIRRFEWNQNQASISSSFWDILNYVHIWVRTTENPELFSGTRYEALFGRKVTGNIMFIYDFSRNIWSKLNRFRVMAQLPYCAWLIFDFRFSGVKNKISENHSCHVLEHTHSNKKQVGQNSPKFTDFEIQPVKVFKKP